MSDWGGPQLLVGGPQERRIARLVICSCEAFDNVPPKGSARLLPLLARVPGGVTAAMLPFRFQPLRRLPMTFGQMSRRPVPREVMDRWFSPLRDPRIREDLRRYVLSAGRDAANCSTPRSGSGPSAVPRSWRGQRKTG